MTLRTIHAGGSGDHTTIAAAEAVAAYGDELRIIDTATYTENITWSGASGTPSASNDLKVTALTECGGSFTTGPLHRATSGHVNTVGQDWMHFIGYRVQQAGTGVSDECYRINSGVANVLMERQIITASGRTSDQDGIYTGTNPGTTGPITAVNCIFKGFGRAGLHVQNNSPETVTFRAVHCVFDQCGDTGETESGGINGTAGVNSSRIVAFDHVYNCISARTQSTFDDYSEVESGGVVNWTGTNNASSDTSLTSRGIATNAVESSDITAQCADPDNDDYSITTGSDYYGAGVDRTSSLPDSRCDLTVDIAGATRPSPPSIGAFDVAAGGGATSLALPPVSRRMQHLLRR